ncbi:hypothetical protein KAW18_00585 [candidate division WOR-3 bacterium]|nr:hypothetical protein [candidate division WOR-3 bacterium]
MSNNILLGSPEWARFEDWLSNEAGKYHYWTVVAELESYSGVKNEPFTERRATLSYLARNKKESVLKAFEYDGWDTQYDQGNVHIEESAEGIICHEDLGDDAARVFITLKDEIGPFPAVWKLWPTFENYFNLRNDEKGNLIDPYNGDLVVEIPYSADKGPVRVRTDYLQDYLAARNMMLIRQHDHRRYWLEPIRGLSEHEGNGTVHKEKWGCYRLDIVNSQKSSMDRFSRLVAKNIVTPYELAGTVGRKRQAKVAMEDYPEFITSKGLDGKEIRQKPNPNGILYPTYFNPKVLKRYYDEPSRYSVGFHTPGMGSVSFLDQWIIPIGRNDEGLIIVWLGDLAKGGLSYEEIVHWRVHNVPPRGGMAMDFWNAQMMCNPTKTPSLESRLIDCKYAIIKAVEAKGKKIYKPYKGPDRYIEKTLRIPLFDEHAEFRETVSLLSKMFIEYLDNESFRNDLPDEYKNDRDGIPLGSIVVFSNWLEQVIGVSTDTVETIKRALQTIQMVRSKTGVAHRFSDSSYQEVIQRLGLSRRITAKLLYSSITEPFADSLEKLCKALEVKNKLWWIKYAND